MSTSETHILMIEDRLRHQEVYGEAIREALPQAQIEFCDEGAAALERLDADPQPDLILLDLNLGDAIDGEAILKRLRQAQDFDHIPVIILTGSTDTQTQLRVLADGADDFIDKSAPPATVIARIRAQLRHKRTFDRLEQLAIDRDLFAATVLDDIRNLETGLVQSCRDVQTKLRQASGKQWTELKQDFSTLRSLGQEFGRYAAQVIEDIRSPVRTLAIDTVDLSDAFARIQSLLKQEAGSTPQIQVDWQGLDQQLRPVIGDARHLQLVLMQIIRNSLAHASANGAVTLTIEQSSPAEQPDQVTTSVADNGPGLADEDLRRVFQPYQKNKNASAPGIGLPLARKLVRSMGGKIWAESTKAGGLCVSFSLPAAES